MKVKNFEDIEGQAFFFSELHQLKAFLQDLDDMKNVEYAYAKTIDGYIVIVRW